jgi:HPt (histidine-containing phosphotransfer) domain-containing protein
VLDVDATLDRIGGNTQLFDRLVRIFRRQTPPLVTELHAALQDGDAVRARELAHKLKGSLRSVGGNAAQAIAARLEEEAAAAALGGATALYAPLAEALARLDDAIGAYLGGGDADGG